MSLLDELIGWMRLTVGSTAQRFRPHLHITGATAVDNPAEESTDITVVGAVQVIGAAASGIPEVHYPTRNTLDFVGMTASDDPVNDILTLTVVQPDPEFVHASDEITYYRNATLAVLTIPRVAGSYQIQTYYTMHDRTNPFYCAYHEAVWMVRRDDDGSLHACSTSGLGGIPETSNARLGNFGGFENISPYCVVGDDTLTFMATSGGLVPSSVFDVACDVRLMTYPDQVME